MGKHRAVILWLVALLVITLVCLATGTFPHPVAMVF